MHPSTMLLIGDDPAVIEAVGAVGRSVGGLGLSVLPAIGEAESYPAWGEVALVLIHERRRGPASEIGGLLRSIAAARRPVPTLVLAEQYDADQALGLFRLGLADYIGCPFDPGRLGHLVDAMTARIRLGGGGGPGPDGAAPDGAALDGGSAEADRLMAQVRRVAPQGTTILLGGESGTGKTRLARRIHELSGRRSEPFVVAHCGALSAHLIESELFGHARGSFTGAHRDHPGKFAAAGRGTLFLDEVDSLPMAVQSKLLRVVEDREFEPVGSNRPEPVRARLIAASNRALDGEVAAGRFRSDLFYRLNVVGFQIPPLRDRRGAIPALAGRFLAEFAAKAGRPVGSIDGDALRALMAHDWPGNVRELRNAIERAVALADGPEVRREDLPGSIAAAVPRAGSPAAGTSSLPALAARATLAQIKNEAEVSRIVEALGKHGNNRLRAAVELGISRMTLYKKLYKFGLMNQDDRSRGGVA